MGSKQKKRRGAWVICGKVVVIIFWVGTISVLIKRHYFSDESRMAQVPPEKIFEMFFLWSENVELTILKDGRRIGQMSLSAHWEKNSFKEGEKNTGGLREISAAGTLDSLSAMNGESAGDREEQGVYWSTALSVDEKLNFPKGDLALRIPELKLRGQFAFDHPSEKISLMLRSKGQRVFEYDGNPSGLSDLPELGWLGRLLPLEALMGGGGMPQSAFEAWAPEILGRYGSAEVAGRRMQVYQLVIKSQGSKNQVATEVTLSLSETGEPLMIQTGWGIEALAEVLVPVGVYENVGQVN